MQVRKFAIFIRTWFLFCRGIIYEFAFLFFFFFIRDLFSIPWIISYTYEEVNICDTRNWLYRRIIIEYFPFVRWHFELNNEFFYSIGIFFEFVQRAFMLMVLHSSMWNTQFFSYMRIGEHEILCSINHGAPM